METFQTVLINSTGRWLDVMERDGLLLCLDDGEKKTVESDGAGLYAAFSSVEWHPDKVVTKPNPDWKDLRLPGTFRVTLRNIDGARWERCEVPGMPAVFVPNGIEVSIDVEPGHPIAQFVELRVELAEDWKESAQFPGYIWPERELQRNWVKRSDEELRKIAEMLKQEAGNEEA